MPQFQTQYPHQQQFATQTTHQPKLPLINLYETHYEYTMSMAKTTSKQHHQLSLLPHTGQLKWRLASLYAKVNF